MSQEIEERERERESMFIVMILLGSHSLQEWKGT